jgi:hypothetical protein
MLLAEGVRRTWPGSASARSTRSSGGSTAQGASHVTTGRPQARPVAAAGRAPQPSPRGAASTQTAEAGRVDQRILSRSRALRTAGAPVEVNAADHQRATARWAPCCRARSRASTARDGLPDDTAAGALQGSGGPELRRLPGAGRHARARGRGQRLRRQGALGRRIIVRPPATARFAPEENVIVGNTVLYGATGGRGVLRGRGRRALRGAQQRRARRRRGRRRPRLRVHDRRRGGGAGNDRAQLRGRHERRRRLRLRPRAAPSASAATWRWSSSSRWSTSPRSGWSTA